MSVWPVTAGPVLSSSNGALISVSIHVDPRNLESLLEALACVAFPINPQIYHGAVMVYRYADGHDLQEPAVLVEFPAYDDQMGEVQRALDAYGFERSTIQVTGMLEEIHSEARPEAAPQGVDYVSRYRVKHAMAAG